MKKYLIHLEVQKMSENYYAINLKHFQISFSRASKQVYGTFWLSRITFYIQEKNITIEYIKSLLCISFIIFIAEKSFYILLPLFSKKKYSVDSIKAKKCIFTVHMLTVFATPRNNKINKDNA